VAPERATVELIRQQGGVFHRFSVTPR